MAKNVEIRKLPAEAKVNLLNIIKERKAEKKFKAELKRQTDLQRIRDMKSTSGIDPLDLFPEEIWEKILTSLEPEDRGNCMQVHPIFSRLIGASKLQDILFPQVVQLDAFQRCFKSNIYQDGSAFVLSKVLRCISPTIRKSYDAWIDASFEKRIQEPEGNSTLPYRSVCISFNRNHRSPCQRISCLLKAFGESKNPAKRFFPRELRVSLKEDIWQDILPEEEIRLQRRRSVFRNKIFAALDLIGNQIWHFQCLFTDLHSTSVSFQEIYTLFQGFVSRLPNLRWLKFSVEGVNLEGTDQVERKRNLLDFLRNHPFPHVASLERITISFECESPSSSQAMQILQAVIAGNPEIKTLDVENTEDGRIQVLPAHQIKSLIHLHTMTMLPHRCRGTCSGLKLGLIEPMFNFSWPLRSIYLEVDIRTSSFGSLLAFLNSFSSLQYVYLKLGRLKMPREKLKYLKLPNLSNLEIFMVHPNIDYDHDHGNIHFFFSLQCLVHCGKLKRLSWHMSGLDDATKLRNHLKKHEKPGKTIDFRAGLRIVYKSNIWDVFPSLESCKVYVWKAEYKTDKVHIQYTEPCTHEYERLASDQRRMSIAQFSSNHGCYRRDDRLQNCVAQEEKKVLCCVS